MTQKKNGTVPEIHLKTRPPEGTISHSTSSGKTEVHYRVLPENQDVDVKEIARMASERKKRDAEKEEAFRRRRQAAEESAASGQRYRGRVLTDAESDDVLERANAKTPDRSEENKNAPYYVVADQEEVHSDGSVVEHLTLHSLKEMPSFLQKGQKKHGSLHPQASSDGKKMAGTAYGREKAVSAFKEKAAGASAGSKTAEKRTFSADAKTAEKRTYFAGGKTAEKRTFSADVKTAEERTFSANGNTDGKTSAAGEKNGESISENSGKNERKEPEAVRGKNQELPPYAGVIATEKDTEISREGTGREEPPLADTEDEGDLPDLNMPGLSDLFGRLKDLGKSGKKEKKKEQQDGVPETPARDGRSEKGAEKKAPGRNTKGKSRAGQRRPSRAVRIDRRAAGVDRRKSAGSGFILTEVIKWGIAALAAVFIIMQLTGGRVSDTPFQTVSNAVISNVDTDKMNQANNQMFRRLYGLNPDDYENVLLYTPSTNMGAEEVLLIRLKNKDQEQTALDAIQARIDTQKNSFEGYGAEQTAMLQKSVVDSDGGYILFVSSANPEAVKSAFENVL